MVSPAVAPFLSGFLFGLVHLQDSSPGDYFICASHHLEPRREDGLCHGRHAREGVVSWTRLLRPSLLRSLPSSKLTITSSLCLVAFERESFICIEPGFVSDFFSLDVGKEWVGKMVLRTF